MGLVGQRYCICLKQQWEATVLTDETVPNFHVSRGSNSFTEALNCYCPDQSLNQNVRKIWKLCPVSYKSCNLNNLKTSPLQPYMLTFRKKEVMKHVSFTNDAVNTWNQPHSSDRPNTQTGIRKNRAGELVCPATSACQSDRRFNPGWSPDED